MTYGFGPLSTYTTTTRPGIDADGFGKQTWFRDATGAGKKDGTIINASWLNHIVGNLSYLCKMANIQFANSHGSDQYLFEAIQQIIVNKFATTKPPSLGQLSDVTDNATTGQTLIKNADGSWRAGSVSSSLSINQATVS